MDFIFGIIALTAGTGVLVHGSEKEGTNITMAQNDGLKHYLATTEESLSLASFSDDSCISVAGGRSETKLKLGHTGLRLETEIHTHNTAADRLTYRSTIRSCSHHECC